MKSLCDRLRVDFSTAQTGFRDFIDDEGSRIPADLSGLISAVQIIPVTSADAERGFSTMNVIDSSLRNRLGIRRLSNLMFMSLVGPSLEDFNALPYVKQWLASGHRGAFDNQSRKCEKEQKARYSHLKTIFE